MALVDDYAGIIFDYGGVLVFHQTKEDARKMAEIAGLPTEKFDALYWAERGPYDKGLLTAEDYWGAIAEGGGIKLTPDQLRRLIEADVQSWIKFDEQMYHFVETLRARGKRVAVLSNMPHELGQAIRTTTQGFAPFDHVTLSYEVRSIKPEPFIYQHCIEGIGLRPEETLFLDDRPENVKGAQALGIQAIQFTSRDAVIPKLLANGKA